VGTLLPSPDRLQEGRPAPKPFALFSWFDATGRKIAGNWNTFGTGQTKEHWEQFQAYLENPAKNPLPDGYTPPFYKADRIAEYRQAHAAFSACLAAAHTLQVITNADSEGER
jgi:hypothetical protein